MKHHFLSADKDIETLAHDLKRLPLLYHALLEEEDMRRKVKAMERWMEAYRRGATSASGLSDTGAAWFCDLRDRLRQAIDDMQHYRHGRRLQSEADQQERIAALDATIHHIDSLLIHYHRRQE